jgi:hypothetical protein
MEKVIYKNKQGLGIILTEGEQESDFFVAKDFNVCGEIIRVGDYTSLSGLFSSPIRYVGISKEDLKKGFNCMVFYAGKDANLLECKRYYSCFYWISETRLLNKYAHNTVRDFNFVNGEWK